MNPPSLDINGWQTAWAFAAEVHVSQKMPGSEHAYLQHLGMVAFEILNAHQMAALADPGLAVICAMLHDSIEDQGVAYDDLKERFGTPVADGVQALSKRPDLEKRAAMLDSLARIQQQPQAVWCVKLADRISNLGNIPAHWSAEKIEKYAIEAGLILDALGSAHPYLAQRLQQRIETYRAAARS